MKKEIRRGGSPILMDLDDFIILYNLNDKPYLTPDDIKKLMNFSHNALLNHLKRLSNSNFIKIKRGDGEDYIRKYISISKDGERILKHYLNKISANDFPAKWIAYINNFIRYSRGKK